MRKIKLLTVGLILSLLLSVTGLVTAATTGTWTIGTTYVPNLGAGGMTSQSNLKRTNGNYASFNGDAMPNSLGYKVRLVNNRGVSRSAKIGLYKNKTTRAGDNSGVKGRHYYAEVYSSIVEPHGSNVKLHFSADKK